MMKRILILMILAMPIGARAQAVFSQAQILDFYGQPAAPANPPTNYGRVYYDTTSSQMKCLNSDGTNCLSSAGTGTVTSVSGTANQIDVATGTSTPVISIDSSLVLPGTLTGNAAALFNTTTAAAQFLALKNTTAAVVGTSQGSPVLATCGRAFHGSADVEDCMTFSSLPGNGNDAAIAWTIGHTGTSTGTVTLNVPGVISASNNISVGSGSGFIVTTRSRWVSPADGVWVATPNAGTGNAFTRLDFGGSTSSFPALSISSTTIKANLGDGTRGATLAASTFSIVDDAFGSTLNSTANACETAFAPTTLGTGATTTNTGLNCLPGNSIIDAVVARVTTGITGSCTGWSLGDASTAARFASNNTTLTSGTTTDATHIGSYNNTGIASATTGIWQATAAPVKITCAGGNPSAGAIRIIVYSHTPTAPTS